ncbi:MAG: type II secretion system F family protein [Lachnospiraceae bacterium]|nr:type II secretion system F family protein [Lachnospiraceae bacterium]
MNAVGKSTLYGRLRLSEKRLERLSRIWPEQRPEESARRTDRRLLRSMLLSAAGGSLVTAAVLAKGGGAKGLAASLLFLILALLAPVIRSDAKEKEDAARAAKEELDRFPEMVRELAVLLTAGYSVRSAWHRMVTNYMEKKRRTGHRQALFEEMALADRHMQEGESERDALLGFSDRLGIIRYMRLCGLLIGAARGGREDLCDALNLEAEEAEQTRLEEIRTQGETLTARLLLPMILLFALILAVLVLPAFLTW